MHRIDTVNVANVRPVPGAVGSSVGYFQNANPELDQEPTKLDADFFNAIQEAIVRTIVDVDGGNMALNKADDEQLKDAIIVMIARELTGGVGTIPKLLQGHGDIVHLNVTSVQIRQNSFFPADNGSQYIIFTADQTVAITSTGANGRMSGQTETANQWWDLWAIGDSTGTNSPKGFLVPHGVTPVLPAGYNIKADTTVRVRNDASSNFMPFYLTGDYQFYETQMLQSATGTSPTLVLSAGSASSFTDVSLASFVPPDSTMAILNCYNIILDTLSFIRRKGETHEGTQISEGDDMGHAYVPMQTDASQMIQYKKSGGGNLDILVRGFKRPLPIVV